MALAKEHESEPLWLAQSDFAWALTPRKFCSARTPPHGHAGSLVAPISTSLGGGRSPAWWPLPRETVWSLAPVRCRALRGVDGFSGIAPAAPADRHGPAATDFARGAAGPTRVAEPSTVPFRQVSSVGTLFWQPDAFAARSEEERAAELSERVATPVATPEDLSRTFWQMPSVGTWLGRPASLRLSRAEDGEAELSECTCTSADLPKALITPFWQMPSVGTWLGQPFVFVTSTAEKHATELSEPLVARTSPDDVAKRTADPSWMLRGTEMKTPDVVLVATPLRSSGTGAVSVSRQGRLSTLSRFRTPSASTEEWDSESENEDEPVMSPHPLDWPLSREEKKTRVNQISDWERMAVIRQNRRLKRRLSEGPPRHARRSGAEPIRRSLPGKLLNATP